MADKKFLDEDGVSQFAEETKNYVDKHADNADIHVTAADKTRWNGKQNALTAEQLAAVNSGISATDKGNYDAHIANADIHVTATDKSNWNGKQDALTSQQLANIADVVNKANDSDVVHKTGDETISGTKTFSDGVVGNVTGNATSATKLQTARTINGTSFNGTANITTANWGTARNISITDGTNTSTAVSVNGSQAYSLNLPSTIKATFVGNITGNVTGNADTSTKATNNASGNELSNDIIKGLSVNGKVITYTKLDGSTGTITTQDTNTTYSNFVKSGSGAKAGLVPAPSTTAGTTKYLREDGTWQVPPDHTYTVNNATLTIQKNGTTVKTFTANASSNVTANIVVPTKTSELTNDSGFLTTALPIGSYIQFAGNQAPDGFLVCNGGAISRTTYAKLFAVIGTKYGSGDGSTTFNLPNLTDRFLQGSDSVGTVKNAGLPNITGYVAYIAAPDYTSGGTVFSNSALDWGRVADGNVTATIYGTRVCCDLKIDASISNSIYGVSNTVQPNAVTCLICIKY